MSKLVLVVDDDPKNLLLATDLLEVLGCETVTATDGREGVDLCRERRPILVLMDIQMPVMNGMDATRAIRADPEISDTPIVAVTASVMAAERAMVMESGVDGFIVKPIDVPEFMKTVKEFLERGRAAGGET